MSSKEENPKDILWSELSKRAQETLDTFVETTGLGSVERVVEELAFAMLELQQIVDLDKDPFLEPEAARRQTETMRGILQRFKRFPK